MIDCNHKLIEKFKVMRLLNMPLHLLFSCCDKIENSKNSNKSIEISNGNSLSHCDLSYFINSCIASKS